MLRAAAILGDRTELSLAAALAGLDPKAALTAASALVSADLLRHENPLEFTHPVVRTAVLEEMGADERTRAQRRAAEILLERGALLEQAATYLVRTVPAGDPFVVETLRRRPERARRKGRRRRGRVSATGARGAARAEGRGSSCWSNWASRR